MSFLDIQSWWEVPSIAYFCSLFRTAFNLLDFDIEELEEALLTDGTEESACSLLTELIVRLLNGCLGNNEISAFNYQMFLRRIFRRKCQSTGRYNPFNTDIDFQFLPLRTKVEILYALCDFRLDADDVFDLFKNLEAESLRVEPLGWDDNASAYWYFYGTRLYREDFIKKPKAKSKSKRRKSRDWKRRVGHGDVWIEEDDTERVWQVVCFTEADWAQLTNKFKKATSKVEKELYRSLSQNFLPEIPKLFQEKERLQRKRLLELAPRRTSNRVLEKIKQKEEDSKQSEPEIKEEELDQKTKDYLGREDRARKREILRSQSPTSDSSEEEQDPNATMPHKSSIRKSKEKKSKNSSAAHKGEPPPDIPIKPGRKTNNSLACATGQILIADDEPVNTTRKKLKTSQIFSQSEEDIKTDMYKVLEQLTNHDDAWPFMDPVEEDYAPNYYAVIRRPMDLKTMEERLDSGHYRDFNMFKSDFKLIVNNCRLYNGQDNEYTQMVDNLQAAFDKLTGKYFDRGSSTDEEIAVEFPAPTMSRKHKVKGSESPVHHKNKRRKEDSDTEAPENKPNENELITPEKKKESRKDRGKSKKKHKTHHHHHHGKHSKSHKKYSSHKKSHEFKRSSKHSKKLKRLKEGKKSKSKHRKGKHADKTIIEKTIKRSGSKESLISSRSRSASPLPSIHTPSPTPSPEPPSQISDSEFFKDKYDKIKERRRQTAKDNWDPSVEVKARHLDKLKQNVSLPDKDKNQKLRETIEKLKAKNERYKDNALFNLLASKKKSAKLVDPPESVSSKGTEDIDFSDDSDSSKVKRGKKSPKIVVAKNESASEALEEAVKDISKWFDDAPASVPTKVSPNNSPALTISTDEQDNSRLDDDFSNSEKNMLINKKELRKRPSSREPKIPIPPKRREIQRTIDRLQPGKSKGNLLTNAQTAPKVEEVIPVNTKVREIKTVLSSKSDEDSPKLSLGSVLPEAGFTLGTDHNFEEEVGKPEIEEQTSEVLPEIVEEIKAAIDKKEEKNLVKPPAEEKPQVVKQDIEPKKSPKANQEKATPNLSAWFKAFGAPKSTGPTKKKTDDLDTDEKQTDANQPDVKALSPKTNVKYDSPNDAISPLPEGGDSPSMNPIATPRQRRTSTGSSVSERSSFSQDLDSPRHQISHTSPLLRSPASPRTDDFQKITYPIINGSVRVGFYQDTASIRSSPEKSCSPRDGPQSPYSPYSPHVYAASTSSNNYFTDHNKSPLPNYGNTQASFYDGTKTQMLSKGTKSSEDYVTIASESYHAQSPYSQCDQQSPRNAQNLTQSSTQPNIPQVSDTKIALFPVKKRHNETEQFVSKKGSDGSVSTSTTTPSIDEIAQALSEKSELAKLRLARERTSMEMMERNMQNIDRLENLNSFDPAYDRTSDKDSMELENLSTGKIQPALMDKKKMESVDMINMGYLNIDERRPSSDAPDADVINLMRESLKTSNIPTKIYNMEGINMNLGMGVQSAMKQNPGLGSMHAKQIEENINRIPDKSMHDYNMQHNISDYNHSTGESQPLGNFTLNDLETAAKKLYSCVNSTAGQDYETWKLSTTIRKPELNASGFPGSYSSSEATDHNKHKSNISIPNTNLLTYNKSNSLHHQQNLNYNPNLLKSNTSQHAHSELRIPNPRGAMKNDLPETSGHENESRNIDNSTRMLKSEKLVQNHPLVSPLQFKTPYSSHSALPMETIRNIPNLPQMLERYSNEERYLSSFAGNTQLYHEKTLQMAQMFNKSLTPDTHPVSSSSIYAQSPLHATKDNNPYKPTTNLQAAQIEVKNKNKRRGTPKPVSSSNQVYHTSYASSSDSNVLSCAKPNVVPGSAFNFGPSSGIGLGSGLYGDNSGFSLEDFRNSTANQFIAANYMAAAAAAHQRSNNDANVEKLVKPAHQNSSHSTAGSFPFMGHSQVRAGYPFVGSDASSPIYQQYLQRQEELLRQTGAQIMGLYPAGYPGSLGVRQPYDSMNRPSWL